MAISTAPNSKDYCEDRKKKKKQPSAPNIIREQKHELLLWASLTYFTHMSLHYFAAHLQVIWVIHVMLFSFSDVFSGCIQGHQKSGLFAFFIYFYSLWVIARSHTALPCFLASAHPFFPSSSPHSSIPSRILKAITEPGPWLSLGDITVSKIGICPEALVL